MNHISVNERRILDLLREQYESDGYTFITHPPVSTLPSEFGSFRPDAIAIKEDERTVIEIKGGSSTAGVQQLQKVMSSLPNWSMRVVKFGDISADAEVLDLSLPPGFFTALNEFNFLVQTGRINSALLLGWGLLETVLTRTLHDNYQFEPSRAPSPLELISNAELHGVLAADDARFTRKISQKRAAIAHGKFRTLPSFEDVVRLQTLLELLLVDVVT
ncbi:hypothetical protein [Maricaulis sp.]|uniref:hypothetical protein n=1 Tax=Maricaulis sp. TaxID=1486257 RepID=UPI003A8E9F4C